MVACPRCGSASSDTASFCASCGTPVRPATPVSPSELETGEKWQAEHRPPEMPDELFRPTEVRAAEMMAPVGLTSRRGGAASDVQPAAWRPLPPGTPESDLLPSEMATPTTKSSPRRRRRGRGTTTLIIILTLLLAGGLFGLYLWFSGPLPTASPRPAPSVATSPGAIGSGTSSAASPSPTASRNQSQGVLEFPPPGTSLCGDTVAVGPNTSCAFAADVTSRIPANPPNTFSVTAHSSVTNKDYQLNCVNAGTYIACTGGNNASVYVKT